MLRACGGALYLTGAIIMTYNLIKTAYAGTFIANEEAEAAPLTKVYRAPASGGWHHRILEHKPILFTVLSLVAILIGGAIEMVPTFLIKSNIPTIASVKPYTPLELHGRDIYIREGCVNCHTQMVRPFRSETERYGEYSKAGEYVYDHPFLWGSKRTGLTSSAPAENIPMHGITITCLRPMRFQRGRSCLLIRGCLNR